MPRTQQRKRGASFRIEYTDAASCGGQDDAAAAESPFRRSPTLTKIGDSLLPPKPEALSDRLTVVLDLDETLVYAREGPLYVRPGTDALLAFLGDHCETVVWTSSIHRYADAVVAHIDNSNAVQHTIYRHPSWFRGNSATKELKLLGRDLDQTIIIENTPDCIRGYEQNGILIEDYEGGELEDHTLVALLEVLKDLVRRHKEEKITVPEFIRTCQRLRRRDVPTDLGTFLSCNCLAVHDDPAVSCTICAKQMPLVSLMPHAGKTAKGAWAPIKKLTSRRHKDVCVRVFN